MNKSIKFLEGENYYRLIWTETHSIKIHERRIKARCMHDAIRKLKEEKTAAGLTLKEVYCRALCGLRISMNQSRIERL